VLGYLIASINLLIVISNIIMRRFISAAKFVSACKYSYYRSSECGLASYKTYVPNASDPSVIAIKHDN
jgi:hypothetical protein